MGGLNLRVHRNSIIHFRVSSEHTSETMGSCNPKPIPIWETATKTRESGLPDVKQLRSHASSESSGYDMLDVFLIYELHQLEEDYSDVLSVEPVTFEDKRENVELISMGSISELIVATD